MIISGGENIYSAEVENALMSYPAVLQCAVIGVPDPKWGEAVHAYVQLRNDATTTTDDLQVHGQSLIAKRSEEHTSELQSLTRTTNAVSVLQTKNTAHENSTTTTVNNNTTQT